MQFSKRKTLILAGMSRDALSMMRLAPGAVMQLPGAWRMPLSSALMNITRGLK